MGIPKEIKISEKYRTSPLSPYGSSKLQGEELLNYFSKKYQFNSYSLRFLISQVQIQE